MVEKRKIDTFLETLTSKYSNYTENSVVRENAAKELDYKIDSIVKLGYLSDIPLKVFRILKNPHGKGALIQFYTENLNTIIPERMSDRLTYDLIGMMDEKIANSIKEDSSYIIFGKYLKRLNETEVFLLVNQVYYSPRTEINKDVISDVYKFNIGILLYEIDSVKVSHRNRY
jgi:hypothetical protein